MGFMNLDCMDAERVEAAPVKPRRIQGESTPEPEWQRWLQQLAVPGWQWSEHAGPSARLVVVAPHPDDEVLACGGLLAMATQSGSESLVVAVTDGEASHSGSAHWTTDRLRATRRGERAMGLAQLGLSGANLVRMGLPDGQVARHSAVLTSRLTALLRPGDVVVSTWRLDAHPDHDAAGACAALACRASGCRLAEAPVWMWHWAVPGDWRVPWNRLRAVQLQPRAWERKQAALSAHASQLSQRGPSQGPVLDNGILARSCRDTEYFFI